MGERFTVADLRRELAGFPDNAEVQFDGGLTFSKVKPYWNSDDEKDEVAESIVILFSQAQAALSERFQKQHPEILVAFTRITGSGAALEIKGIPTL
ncbi:MAG TPA: hypothetical protein VGO52_20010 [Hyphomonadaceae bacterium]|jgi:hypothetical protein|nr:hypothetical protein [Hyphomonadaceae bacterium]